MTTPIRPTLSLAVFHALLDACLITVHRSIPGQLAETTTSTPLPPSNLVYTGEPLQLFVKCQLRQGWDQAIRQLDWDGHETGPFLNADVSPESYVVAFFAALTYYVDIGGSSFLNNAPGSYYIPSPTLTAEPDDSIESVPEPTGPTSPPDHTAHRTVQPPVSESPPRASSCGPYEPELKKSLTNLSPFVAENGDRSATTTTAKNRYREHPLGIRRTSSHPVATRLELDALASADEVARGSTLGQNLPGERMVTWHSTVIDPSLSTHSFVVQQTCVAEPFVVYEIPVPLHIWANPDLPMHRYLQVSVNAVGRTGDIDIPSALDNQPSVLAPPTNDWVLARLVNGLYPLTQDTNLSDAYLLSNPSCIADDSPAEAMAVTNGSPIPYSLPEIQSKQSTISFHLFPALQVHAEFIQTWSPLHRLLALYIHNPIASVCPGRTYRIQSVDLSCDDLVIEDLATPSPPSKNASGLPSSIKNSNRVNLDIAVAAGASHSLVFKVRPKLPQNNADSLVGTSSTSDQGLDAFRCLEVQISGTPVGPGVSHVSFQQYKNTFQFNLTPCFPYFSTTNSFVRVFPSAWSNTDEHPVTGTNFPGNSTEMNSTRVSTVSYNPEGLPHALPVRISLPSTHLAPAELDGSYRRWSSASAQTYSHSTHTSLCRDSSSVTDDRTLTYRQSSMSASTVVEDHGSTYRRVLQPIPTRQHVVPVGWDHRSSLPPVPPGTARMGSDKTVLSPTNTWPRRLSDRGVSHGPGQEPFKKSIAESVREFSITLSVSTLHVAVGKPFKVQFQFTNVSGTPRSLQLLSLSVTSAATDSTGTSTVTERHSLTSTSTNRPHSSPPRSSLSQKSACSELVILDSEVSIELAAKVGSIHTVSIPCIALAEGLHVLEHFTLVDCQGEESKPLPLGPLATIYAGVAVGS